jgi:hypothetical protein
VPISSAGASQPQQAGCLLVARFADNAQHTRNVDWSLRVFEAPGQRRARLQNAARIERLSRVAEFSAAVVVQISPPG